MTGVSGEFGHGDSPEEEDWTGPVYAPPPWYRQGSANPAAQGPTQQVRTAELDDEDDDAASAEGGDSAGLSQQPAMPSTPPPAPSAGPQAPQAPGQWTEPTS